MPGVTGTQPDQRGKNGFNSLPTELQILVIETAFLDPKRSEEGYFRYKPLGCSSLALQSLQVLTSPEQSWELATKREHLKKARLLSRIFCRVLTPAVFVSIHISSNVLSVQRAHAIISSHLAHHAREIVYHSGGWPMREQDPSYSNFYQQLSSHRYRNDYPTGIHPKRIEKALYSNYILEIESARNFAQYDFNHFKRAMKTPPNLITIAALPYHRDFNDVETSWYTLKRCGLIYLPEPTTAYGNTWLCDLMHSARLEVLNCMSCNNTVLCSLIRQLIPARTINSLGDNDAQNVAPDAIENHNTIFCTLQHLTLTHLEQLGAVSLACDLFQSSPNLNTLVLRLGLSADGTDLVRDYTRWMGVVDYVASPGTLSKLVRLEVEINHEIKGSDLARLVLGCKSSLRHLAIRNAWIGQRERPSGPLDDERSEESLLRTLYEIYKGTSLETCMIEANCTDIKDRNRPTQPAPRPTYFIRGVELFRRATSEDFQSLNKKRHILAQVMEAMCRRRQWPLPLDLDLKQLRKPGSPEYRAIQFCFASWDDTQNIFEEHEEIEN